MSIKSYVKSLSTRKTPQSEPIPGKAQVANSAGGFAFEVDDWMKLERFLILGSEGGSYYATERELTTQRAGGVERCIQADGARTIDAIVAVSDAGRAPRNDPAVFALAMCLKLGDEKTRRLAAQAVPKVCRIGTHLFQFAEAVKCLGGWGRLTHKAFAGWYLGQRADHLALNVVKYQSRESWSHRDLLRKVKVKPTSEEQKQIFRWAVGKLDARSVESVRIPAVILGFEKAKACSDEKELARLIEQYALPRECVPTRFLKSPRVWDALLQSGKGMPATAMIRNLGKMSEVGLLKPLSEATKYVVRRLEDSESLKRARVHPIAILVALSTYQSGHGLRGALSWTVARPIADALDDAFYRAFDAVEPTGKRWLLALDISGSMSSPIGCAPLSCRAASSAMAMLAARSEKWSHVVGFTSGAQGAVRVGSGRSRWPGYQSELLELDLSGKSRLDQVVRYTEQLPMGGTDCALPMLYALEKKLAVDTFVVYTDNETWAGDVHPCQALQQYRKETGRAAKLVVVGMVANDFSIADPDDAGMLDVVGFDTTAPQVMADFARS